MVAAAEVVVAGAAHPERPPDAGPAPTIPVADSEGTKPDLVSSRDAAEAGVMVPAAKPIILLQSSDS